MPANGRIWAADAVEFRISSSGSGSHSGDGTGVYTHGGSIVSYSTPDAVDIGIGISISVGGASSDDSWSVTYIGPGAPGGVTYTGSGWSAVEAYALIENVLVYDGGGAFRMVGALSLFVQGSLELTAAIDLTSTGLAPSYLPLWGIPPTITGACSASTSGLPSYAVDDLYSYESVASGTASGGWRWKLPGGGWESAPVSIVPGSPPTAGSCEDPGIGSVSGSTTASISVGSYSKNGAEKVLFESGTITACATTCICPDGSVRSYSLDQVPPVPWDRYKTTTVSISRGGSAMALPGLSKAIKRFNKDYKALWYRSDMPEVDRSSTASCDANGVVSTAGGSRAVLPHQSPILQAVTYYTAAMEDTLAYPSYAPKTVLGSGDKGITYTTYVQGEVLCAESDCPAPLPGQPDPVCTDEWIGYSDPPPDESYSATRQFTYPSAVGTDLAAYLDHDKGIARYINTWPNPHWSYFLWQQSWELDGSPETWDDYWAKVGSQHLYNASAGISDNTRNTLISDGLEQDGHRAFNEALTAGLPWLGISRFRAKHINPLTDFEYGEDQAALWSSDDGEITVDGSGVSLAIDGAPSFVEIVLDLGSFSTPPYQWPHLADKIEVSWSDSNIGSCSVYLEGVDGSRVKLCETPGNYSRPSGKPTKYAGSWAQDYGAGITSDQGSDALPAGISAGVTTSSEFAYAYQLLADRTAAKLVFVIAPVDPSDPVVIEHPTLHYTLSSQRKLLWENAHQCAVIHPNGPGVRTGIWNSGESGTVLGVPDLYEPTVRPNLIDWLVTERLILRGVDGGDGLTTELTSLFDTYEGQSVGGSRNSSHGFWLPARGSTWRLAMVNSLAECPPMACLPRKSRDLNWIETGPYTQESWVWHQDGSYFVNPVRLPELRADDETTVWTSLGSGVAGWMVSYHSHAVDNSEVDFGVWVKEKRGKDIRPWRGYYMVVDFATPGSWVWNLSTRWGHFYRAQATSEGIRVLRSKGNRPGEWVEDQTVGATDDRRPVLFAGGQLQDVILVWERSGTVLSARTLDDGRTWSEEEEIMPGSYPTANASGSGWRIYASMIFDSGDSGPGKISLRRQGPGQQSPDSPVDLIDQTGNPVKVEEGTFHIYPAGDSLDSWILSAVPEGEEEPAEWISYDDGLSWRAM